MCLDLIRSHLRSESGAVTVDWVVLSAAIVGLGMASVASVRSGTNALGVNIQTALSDATVAGLGIMGDVGQMLEGDWNVAVVSNGVVGGYHSVPWTFERDGDVFAGNLWIGTWEPQPDSSIAMDITHTDGRQHSFSITMDADQNGFTGYENGVMFRRAVRR